MESKVQFEGLLSVCEQEDIAHIDRVQNFGAILAFDRSSFRLVAYSANVPDIIAFNSEETQLLDDLFDATIVAQVLSGVKQLHLGASYAVTVLIDQGEYALSLHSSNAYTVLVALEPMMQPEDQLRLLAATQRMQHFLELRQDINAEFYNGCASYLRELLKYDRVMIYRFNANGDGCVEGESKVGLIDSLLGQNFPASDIPKQARALYVHNKTRLVFDVDAEENALQYIGSSTGQAAIDISATDLRALSPVHKQYLRNMGVAASLSISLIIDGKLWGLIACHNESAKYVSYLVRRYCEVIAAIVSQHIEKRLQIKAHELAGFASYKLRKFQIDVLECQQQYIELDQSSSVLSIVLSDYVAVIDGDLIRTNHPRFGSQQWVSLRDLNLVPDEAPIFHSSRMLQDYRDFTAGDPSFAGVLLICVNRAKSRYVVWFKNAVTKSVTWGGNPNKAVELSQDGQSQIGPRLSFDKWVECRSDMAEEWEQSDLNAINDLLLLLRFLR